MFSLIGCAKTITFAPDFKEMYALYSNKKPLRSLSSLMLLCFFLFTSFASWASEQAEPLSGVQVADSLSPKHNAHAAAAHESSKFNAGEMIMEHIGDAYEWHILTLGEKTEHPKHISIPLPILIYEPGQGFVCFSSSNLKDHHTHLPVEYKGYILNGKHIAAVDGRKFYDISITKNVVSLFISLLLLCIVFISVARSYTRNPGKAPKGLQSLVEPLITFVRDEIARPSIGDRHEKFLPFLLTVFFFIFFNNIMGLIPFFPGGANVSGNIAITMTLALLVFLITTFSTNKDYWIHIFNTPGVPWWLKFPVPLMPIVELMGVLTKPMVLTLRLFANITAGHIIVLAFFSLIFIFGEMSQGVGYGVSVVSIAFTIFMNCLELLVAFLQAYVFTLLSAIYFGSARVEHHHEEHH